ncbi:MAG: hypothetical protein F2599_02020, partial [Actinobacteria bacterium]|nr:hypothetical protein [Actinomycetota bacterium]
MTNKSFARHGRIKVQSKSSAIWGLVFKGVGLTLGAALAISGIAFAELSNSIRA